MRQIITDVFKYNELSDSAKEAARNWWREASLNDSFYEHVYTSAAHFAGLLGITINTRRNSSEPDIMFTGFCSQGDGACFNGSYAYAKGAPKAIKAYAPKDAELLRIAVQLQAVQRKHFYRLEATAKHSGHYYHSGCMSVEVYDTEDQYRDIGSAEEDVRQLLRDFADWIYEQLENENNFYFSDENVEENIILNEYEFDKDGKVV